MSDCGLETQSWTATDQFISRQTARLTGFRTTCAEALFNGIADARIEAMCGWSMSLTRFGVAKLRAAVRAMLKQYDALPLQVDTWWRITSLPSSSQKTNCDSPRYSADSRYI
jgi:hypothetical protein